jgi:4-hydroxy-tetrahydrodipicolinate synthase
MELKAKYSGVIVPMVSPFNDNFSVDKNAVKTIVNSFILNEIKPFIIGTTGEGVSISAHQKLDLLKSTVDAASGKQPVLAGISGNSIFTSIEEGKVFADMGVSALVATLPNFYPMDASQMANWFEMIANSVPLPLFIYNIPATTHHSVPLEVIEKLSYHPNIIGVKDSERNQERLDESLKLWKHRNDFLFLVGWAAMSTYGLEKGASGIIPSTGNLCPELFQQLYQAVKNGNTELANELQQQTDQISTLYQKGRNLSHSLVALKVIMSMKNLCGTQVMPPLFKMSAQEEIAYRRDMLVEFKNLNI